MIDKNKTYKTRDGREVRIYATDGVNGVIHGAILMKDGWSSCTWTSNGEYWLNNTHDFDLIEVKPKIKGWVNFYPNNVLWNKIYETKKEADHGAASHRIACIEIEFTEGDGI